MAFGNEMIRQLLANWELTLDVIQIFLCFLILLFLIRDKRKLKSMEMKSFVNADIREFNTEVMIQAIKQQANRTFDTIMGNLDREKQNWERLIGAAQMKKNSKPTEFRLSEAGTPSGDSESGFTMGQHLTADDSPQTIENLAMSGLGAAEIASQLKIPLEEVELILRIAQPAVKKSVGSTA